MNAYFVQGGIDKNRDEILKSLRSVLQDQYPQAEIDPVLSLAYDRNNQFFLKSPQGILWGRVFYETLAHANVQTLRKEIDHLLQTFRQKVFPFVFFPSAVENLSGLIEKLPGDPVLYEYSGLRSHSGSALALVEKFFAADSRVSSLIPSKPPEPLQDYRFWRRSRLTRDELIELVDLSLELKKNKN